MLGATYVWGASAAIAFFYVLALTALPGRRSDRPRGALFVWLGYTAVVAATWIIGQRLGYL